MKTIRPYKSILEYRWWEHPEYRATICAKLSSSCSEAKDTISLSRRHLSVKPPKQYLKMVKSEI